MKYTLIISAILALAACEEDTASQGHLTKALGESARPVIFQGEGSGPMPNYDERVLSTFINRLRVNADNFGVMDRDGNPIPPLPPYVYSAGAAEAGRWQGKHALEFSCNCPQANPPVASAYNSCCDIGFVDGIAQCVGPLVTCDSEQATEERDRWLRLNSGDSEITSETFGVTNNGSFTSVLESLQNQSFGQSTMFSPAVTSIGIPPMNCVQEMSSCGSGGKCLDAQTMAQGCTQGGDENPDCIGQCAGGPRGGESCIIPEPLGDECLPENYPRSFYWTFAFGLYNGVIPAINDGIHITIPGQNMGDPATLSFWVNYADVAGSAQSLTLVHDGTCADLALEFPAPPPEMEFPFHGETYRVDFTQGDFTDGCVKYVFSATSADGFIYSYPSLGSLQAKVLDGVFVPDDESCPVWTPDRVDTSCLPAADQCNNGDTRLCYSGREGSQGKGACKAGSENCVRGRWSGSCEGEVLPESEDVCGDDNDNNCNGFVDEGCPIIVTEQDMGNNNNEPDMGSTTTTPEEDMGGGQTTNLPEDTVDEEGGCCSTASEPKPQKTWLLSLLLLGLVFYRRKKS